MGQYFYVANIDKKQFLHPHTFGDGLKLLEFGASGRGTMAALALLLADNRDGDRWGDSPLIGSWCGDRIVVAGDYGPPDSSGESVHDQCSEEFEDISEVMREVLDSQYDGR